MQSIQDNFRLSGVETLYPWMHIDFIPAGYGPDKKAMLAHAYIYISDASTKYYLEKLNERFCVFI